MSKVSKAGRLAFPPASWEFTAWQRAGWDDTSALSGPKWVGLVAGRGAGKDILAMRCIMRDALKLYGRRKAGQAERARRMAKGLPLVQEAVTNPLVKVWIVGPQQYNINQAWDDWRGMLLSLAAEWAPALGKEPGETEWLFTEVVREGKFIIFGKGEIEVEQRITQTKNALRGPGVDLVQWTEAAIENVPGEFKRALNEELRGTTVRAGRYGRVYFTTSPKGPMGGWWEECKKRLGGEEFRELENASMLSPDGRSYYRHGTSYTNTFFSAEQLEEIRAESVNGWQYDQERLAKYVLNDVGGSPAFSRENLAKCLVDRMPERGGTFRQISIGCDIARLGNDETCYVEMDDDTGELLSIEFHKKLLGTEVRDDIIRLKRASPGCEVRVDSTGHRGYVKDFLPPDVPVVETQFGREKEKWVGGLRMLMEMGAIRIPDPDKCAAMDPRMREAIRKLLHQIINFQRVIKQSGAVEFRHPQGEHDDGVDALMMAAMKRAAKLQERMGAKETKNQIGRLVV